MTGFLGCIWYLWLGFQDPVIYRTARVHEQSPDRVTATVTVIGRETIEASGAQTLADLLWLVPGVNIVEQGRVFAAAFIRGGDANFTRVMIDGVAVNNLAYQVGGIYDLTGIPAAMVERVEVVCGPLSSAYGSTGLAGVIHVITRTAETGFAAQVAGGDAESRQAAVRGSLAGGRHQVSMGYNHERGRIAEEAFEGLWLRTHAAFSIGGSELALTGRLSDHDNRDYPDASGGPVWGDGRTRNAAHREIGLGASLGIGPRQKHRLQLSAFQHEMDRNSPAIGIQVPASVEEIRYSEAQFRWRSTLLQSETLSLSAGGDLVYQEADNRSVLDLGFPLPGDYRGDRNLAGAALDVSARTGSALWEMSLRFDHGDGHDAWSPRLGFRRPIGDLLDFRFSAGRAFKLPDFFALASPEALGGNPDLVPETALGGDVGLAGQWAKAKAGVTLFHNRFSDLVDFDFASFRHVNRSKVRATGVELFAGWRHESLQGGLNLTWQDVDLVGQTAELRHRPAWQGTAYLGWRPAPGWMVAADAVYKGAMADAQLPVPELTRVDGYWLVGAKLECRLTSMLRLQVHVDNLTNHGYETLIGFPGAGRSWRLALRADSL